ncbi:hypothetical protein PLICRDRAFT_30637 [Plicaturopsis crispa FD-325 SS-3]|nr:hypothetical protein PLICRDRAFT_30637 [Plicaturopsis crispa FD-325 SS-3]
MSDPAGSSLPSELWLQIFADDVFEKNDHRYISLTCRQFRPLAQPFLLRALTLQQVFQHWISDLDGRPRDFEDRLQRFQFYASDAIAPALQNLSVLLPYDHISRPGFKELRGPVLEALFRALPHFVNLHTIDFVSVALTAHHLEVISGLRSVRRARFHECAILAEAQAVPRLLVKHLEITTSGRTQAALWAATLDPESLQSLLISPSPTFLSLTSTPHFPRLRALSIDIIHDEEHGLSTLESEDFRAFLLRSCSAVEQVEVYSDTPVISPVVLRGALPLLREYCGPYEVESLFTESRSVRHLTLRGTCWPSLPPRQIVEIWEGSSALPDLVSLDAQTGNLKGLSPFELPLLLLHVQSRCNRLRALTVCYDYCIDTIDGNSALVRLSHPLYSLPLTENWLAGRGRDPEVRSLRVLAALARVSAHRDRDTITS